MKKQVIETIRKYEMISLGETVVLAVSGGVDSMVLMHLFAEFAKDFELTLVVAHLDHQRRAHSALDAKLIRQVAKNSGFAFELDTLPKQGEAGNFHAYARSYRYGFLKQVAKDYQATKVATAHHAEDHLETVIDHLLKTDVPAGLIGIRPVGTVEGVCVIRPFIEIKKQDLYEYAQTFHVDFHEDESNASDEYLRNRIRQKIVPPMRQEREDVFRHVRNLSDNIRGDESYFDQQIDELMKAVRKDQDGYKLSFSWLQGLHASLRRRLVVRLMPWISRGARLGLAEFFASGAASGTVDVGCGTVVKKSYDQILIVTVDVKESLSLSQPRYELELLVNAVNELPNGQKVVVNQGKISANQGFNKKNEKKEAQGTYLCYNDIRMPLMVRNRRAGDKIQLVSGQGHAKVKKMMIDAKIPIDERQIWPIVVDADDLVLWIPRLAYSPVCLDKPSSSKDLWLEIYE